MFCSLYVCIPVTLSVFVSVFWSVSAVPLSRSHVRDVFSVNSIQLSGLASSHTNHRSNDTHTPNASHVGRRISSVLEESSGSGLQTFRERIQSLQIPLPDLVGLTY